MPLGLPVVVAVSCAVGFVRIVGETKWDVFAAGCAFKQPCPPPSTWNNHMCNASWLTAAKCAEAAEACPDADSYNYRATSQYCAIMSAGPSPPVCTG
eukprot:gene18336-13776_t